MFLQAALKSVAALSLFCLPLSFPSSLADGPTVMSMRLRREDLAETKTELLGLWERIVSAWKADSFPATPGKLCEWCSFKSICPAWNFTREEGGEVEGMKSVGGVEGDAWVAGRDAKGGVAQG